MAENTSSAFRSDFFESKIVADIGRIDFKELRLKFENLVRREMEKPESRDLKNDYSRIIEFLRSDQMHDSEGSDLSFTKTAFSMSELKNASTYEERMIPKYLLYRIKFDYYPRNNLVTEFPVVLAIEPTSTCNLRCTMCFQSDPDLSENESLQGYMSLELFRQIIDEGAKYNLSSIVLASRGEPLLHRQIVEMVRYAKEKGVLDVKLNTNATPLTPAISRGLLEAGVDTLVFSVDSADKEEYERIRRRAKFDRVVKNIETFNEIRKNEFPNSKTRTRVSMIVIDEIQDVDKAEKFWGSRVDEFGRKGLHHPVSLYKGNSYNNVRPCSLLWERMYIWWDGTANPCSEDYLSKLAVGKLTQDNSIREIWHSDAMNSLRNLHQMKNRKGSGVCESCFGY